MRLRWATIEAVVSTMGTKATHAVGSGSDEVFVESVGSA